MLSYTFDTQYPSLNGTNHERPTSDGQNCIYGQLSGCARDWSKRGWGLCCVSATIQWVTSIIAVKRVCEKKGERLSKGPCPVNGQRADPLLLVIFPKLLGQCRRFPSRKYPEKAGKKQDPSDVKRSSDSHTFVEITSKNLNHFSKSF